MEGFSGKLQAAERNLKLDGGGDLRWQIVEFANCYVIKKKCHLYMYKDAL